MILSQNEEDILKRIVGYGGYVTKEILALYRHDITEKRCYFILKQLERKGYIKEREYFESQKQPTVYQVTYKACRYFKRPEAYMRKKHKALSIRRYLMRSHFFFWLAGKDIHISMFSSDDRVSFLKSKGFTDYSLPKKYNKEVELIQIEEYIIDKGPLAKMRTVNIVHIDNPALSMKLQISNLLRRYEKMIGARKAFIDFLIVTESQARAKMFYKIYCEQFQERISMIDIKVHSLDRQYSSN